MMQGRLVAGTLLLAERRIKGNEEFVLVAGSSNGASSGRRSLPCPSLSRRGGGCSR